MLGRVLGTEKIAVNKTDKIPAFVEFLFQLGVTRQ